MKPRISLFLSLACCLVGSVLQSNRATAQVTPDGTTNTTVNADGNDFTIQQGDRAGSDLFHSFSEFSVPTGGEAFFDNAADVVNIFSRVTGGNISNIDGLLRANGSANLFLLNPAGIIFGPNARLSIGGSFFGSTADSIVFSDGEFSALDGDNPPLLTINAPIGLNFRDNPGQIVNRSVANGVGLGVATGKSLALVGGNINLEGGVLTASEGKIELGSVAGNSLVTLEENGSGFDFNYDGITNLGNIELTQGAIINSSGNGNGSINLQGNQITLQDGSQVRATTFGSVSGESISVNAETLLIEDRASISTTTIGEGNAGDIKIEASESIEIVGTGFEGIQQNFFAAFIQGEFNIDSLASVTGIITGTTGAGTAGNINLDTSNLRLQENAAIGGLTFGEGGLGSLTINAAESIEVLASALFNTPTLGSTGNGNKIEIETADLTISDGGTIANATIGAGSGGDILINATEEIKILRTLPNSLTPTGIFTNGIIGDGEAGNININTQKLNLQDGGGIGSSSGGLTRLGFLPQGGRGGNINIIASDSIEVSGSSPDSFFSSGINSSTFTANDAGNLDLETRTLIVGQGANISTSTISNGQGGNINIDASESIFISGTSVDGQVVSSIVSASGVLNSTAEFDPSAVTGDAGSLSITTGNLSISDHGRVNVNSLGSGNAGNLEIRANNIQLENQGQIGAKTVFGEGGNITLNLDERLTLRNNSLISAQAEENANGGNVDIDTQFIIAFPSQPPGDGNDIVAGAEFGMGGNINITAESLINIEERPADPGNGTNDIDASSDFGLDGDVSITTPDINRLQKDVELPKNIVETEQSIAQACQTVRIAKNPSGLTIKGKGGVTPQPTEALTADSLIPDGKPITIDKETDLTSLLVGEIETEQGDPNYIPADIKPIKTDRGDIYPARGIIKTEDGQIILTRYPTNNINTRTPHNSANCAPS